jgi:biotin carboxylase
MNIVFLSPHFPPNYSLFCRSLRDEGATVLGIADTPYDSLKPEQRAAMTEYYRVGDLSDYEQVYRACGYFIHAYGRLDRIESLNDWWQETEARLRSDFNIPGIRMEDLPRLIRKSEMKRGFLAAGVTVPRGAVADTPETALEFSREIGFPLVAKPDRGVGAADTRRLESEAELRDMPGWGSGVRYILEEFVSGQLVSFDGLTDRDGKIVFHASHVFSQGIMETVNQDLDIFYYSEREIPEDLEAAGRAAVAAFDLREKFFHIEFFRRPDGTLTGLEVNARPPGGLTTDMFNFANNIDIYREWARVVVHNRFDAEYHRPYHCGYVGRKINKSYLRSHREIMQRYGHLIVHYGPIDSAFASAIGNYAYIANAQTVDEIRDLARYVHESA